MQGGSKDIIKLQKPVRMRMSLQLDIFKSLSHTLSVVVREY